MSLREQVLRGGVALTLRQGLGVVVALGGMFLLTRILGPTVYGLYFTAYGLVVFLSMVAGMALDVYLVRRDDEPDEAVYHQVFSFLLVSSAGLACAGFAAAPLLASWLGDPRYLDPLRALLALLPLLVLQIPALARLERALDYGRIAVIELVELLLQYGLALLLAWAGFGVWSMIAGFAAARLWLAGSSYVLGGYSPRWRWSTAELRPMLAYGLSYSASIWVWQFRLLALAPLVIGRFLGPESVGHAALALRLVEGMSFVRQATWRLSIAALARVQHDLERLRAALQEAMALQLLALGPLLAAFALAGPALVPALFGPQWLPTLAVYPFVALTGLISAMFAMHASVLHVLGHNRAVLGANIVHVAVLAVAGVVLTPRLGLVGWGLAEAAALTSYALFDARVRRLFPVSYGRALPWLAAFVPPLFTPLASWPWWPVLWAPLLVVATQLGPRAQLREYWAVAAGRFARPRRSW